MPTPPHDLKRPCEILKNWDRILSADSTDASLAAMYYYQFIKADYDGAPEPEPFDALRSAAAHLQKHFGRVDVPLGELQRLRRGDVDLPIGGGPRTYNCVHARVHEKDGRLVGVAGDSYVLIVAFDEKGVASSQAIHQYGNVNRPASPHYADQAALFVQRKMRKSWMNHAAPGENTIRDYHPGD